MPTSRRRSYGSPLAKEVLHVHSDVLLRLIGLYELPIVLLDDKSFERHVGVDLTDAKFDVSYILVLDVHDLLPAHETFKLWRWGRLFSFLCISSESCKVRCSLGLHRGLDSKLWN